MNEVERVFRRPPPTHIEGQLSLEEAEVSDHPVSSHEDDVYEAAKEVLDSGTAHTVHGMLLDSFTAGAIKTVGDDLEPENLARLRKMHLRQAASVCMKLVSA